MVASHSFEAGRSVVSILIHIFPSDLWIELAKVQSGDAHSVSYSSRRIEGRCWRINDQVTLIRGLFSYSHFNDQSFSEDIQVTSVCVWCGLILTVDPTVRYGKLGSTLSIDPVARYGRSSVTSDVVSIGFILRPPCGRFLKS